MDETSVCGCNDDGVVLLVRAQFIQDVHNVHSMLLAVFELPLKDMHLILHLRRCDIPLVLLAQSCDPCRPLGLLHPASLHTALIPAECRGVIPKTSPNEFDRHDLTVLTFKLLNT